MAVVQEFTWTDDKVELLLKMVKIFKMKKESTRIGLGLVKSKYETEVSFSVFVFFSLVCRKYLLPLILEKYIGVNKLQLV